MSACCHLSAPDSTGTCSGKEGFSADYESYRLKAQDGACDYYRSDEKVRYARGFMCTINALTVRVADTFRYRMIGYMGRKNYYLKRKGGINLSPADQQQVIAVAKELGVIRKDYFDGYVEEYNWE